MFRSYEILVASRKALAKQRADTANEKSRPTNVIVVSELAKGRNVKQRGIPLSLVLSKSNNLRRFASAIFNTGRRARSLSGIDIGLLVIGCQFYPLQLNVLATLSIALCARTAL